MSIFARFLADGGMPEQRTLTSSSFIPPPGTDIVDDYVGVRRSLSDMTVFACVRLLADTVATLPWKAYRRDKNNVPVEVKPTPAILRSPWPGFDLFQYKWMMVASMALRGNFFGYITSRNQLGYPTSILPLHPDVMFLERRPDILLWFDPVYRVMGEQVEAQDVLHMRRFTMAGDPWGLSPVRQAATTIGMSLAANEYGYRYFKDSANPSGTLSTDQDLDEGAVARQQKEWISSHSGRRLPAVLTNGFQFKPISISPNESQFLETRGFQRSEICVMFGVPPVLIGESGDISGWGCLPGDSLVFTTTGPVPIEEVKAGDEVWSFDTERGVHVAKVTGQVMTGHKPLLTIKTRGRDLRLTRNHHVTIRRYFGRADGRRVGECGWETLQVFASEIRKGDYLIVPHGMADGDCRTSPDGQELTVGKMEFLGLYLGDGNRDQGRVEIAHARDEDHMPHYRKVIENEFGVAPYTDGRGTRTRFSSADVIALIESGFTGKASTKRVPGWVFRLAPELQLALLRGYLDSDGSVNNGSIGYASCNKMLLEDIRHMCMQLGIPVGKVGLGRKAGPMTIKGKTYMSKDKWQLQLSSLRQNSMIGSNSPRKAERFTELAHNNKNPSKRLRQRYDEDWERQGDNRKPIGPPPAGAVYHKVVSIEKGELAVPVYDISVCGPAHYVADGVIVGNTGLEAIKRHAVTFTFTPWTSCMESVLSACLPAGQYVRFEYNSLLRGDPDQRYQQHERGIRAGFLMPNEARAAEELAPAPGGDVLMQPSNAVPLGWPAAAAAGAPDDGQPVNPGRKPSVPAKAIGGGEDARLFEESFNGRYYQDDERDGVDAENTNFRLVSS